MACDIKLDSGQVVTAEEYLTKNYAPKQMVKGAFTFNLNSDIADLPAVSTVGEITSMLLKKLPANSPLKAKLEFLNRNGVLSSVVKIKESEPDHKGFAAYTRVGSTAEINMFRYQRDNVENDLKYFVESFLEEALHASSVVKLRNDVPINQKLQGIASQLVPNIRELVYEMIDSDPNIFGYLSSTPEVRNSQINNIISEIAYSFRPETVNGRKVYTELFARGFASPETQAFLAYFSIDAYGNITKKKDTSVSIKDFLLRLFAPVFSIFNIDIERFLGTESLDKSVERLIEKFLNDGTQLEENTAIEEEEDIVGKLSVDEEELRRRMGEGYEKSEDDGRYFKGSGGRPLDSVTDEVSGGIGLFRKSKTARTDGVDKAKILWANRDPSEKLTTSFGDVNYAEYVEKFNNLYRGTALVTGKIIHLLLEYYMKTKTEAKTEAKAAADKLMADHNINPKKFDWLERNLKSIYGFAGINIFDDIESDRKDQIFSELVIANDLMEQFGLAGTADLFVKHADGTYSIYDFKSSVNLFKVLPANAFKYGGNGFTQEVIYDTPLNRAKLQLMLYAVLAKSKDPSMQFRNLSVLWTHNEWTLNSVRYKTDVDVRGYLKMAEELIKNEHPEVYAQLQKTSDISKLFDSSEYTAGVAKSRDVLEELHHNSHDIRGLVRQKVNKIRQYTLELADSRYVGDKAEVRKRIAQLSKEVLEIENKALGLNSMNWGEDIGGLSMWFQQFSDSQSPLLQTVSALAKEKRTKAQQRYSAIHSEFRSLLLPIYNAYLESTGQQGVAKITGNMLTYVNHKKLFDPIQVDVIGEEGRTGTRWRTEAEIREQIGKGVVTAQNVQTYINFVNFVQDSYAQFFVDQGGKTALANKVVYQQEKYAGKFEDVTNMDLHNGYLDPIRNVSKASAKYDRATFYPKVPAAMSEYIGRWGKLAAELYTRNFTFTHEFTYDKVDHTKFGIPMKYLGLSVNDSTTDYSYNVERQFDLFMRNMILKEELDDVFYMAKGLETTIAKEQEVNPETLKHTGLELQRFLDVDILGIRTKIPTTTYSKGNAEKFSVIKLLDVATSVASQSLLGVKFVGAAATNAYQYIMMWKEAARHSALGRVKINGATGDPYGFTLKDLAFAHKIVWKEVMVDMFKGNLHNNKWYRLAKELRFFPDSFSRMTQHSKQLTSSMKLIDSDHLMAAYSLPEQLIAMYSMIAQLNHMKIATGQYKGTPLHEMYELVDYKNENGDTFNKLEWRKGADGNPVTRFKKRILSGPEEVYENVTGLTAEEISALYNVYARFAGGYKEDERTRLDYYFIGRAFLQFKRYIPNILVTALQSSGQKVKYGNWKVLRDDKNPDLATAEWNAAVMEGRAFVTAKWMLNLMSIRIKVAQPDSDASRLKKYLHHVQNRMANENYNWNQLERGQAEGVVDALFTLTLYAAMSVGYLMLFGGGNDDDDSWNFKSKDPRQYIYLRVMRDLAQFWHPYETIKNVFKNAAPASWTLFADAAMSGMDMTWALMIGDRTQDGAVPGWNKLANTIPVLSGIRNNVRFLADWEQYGPERLK